MWSSVHECVYLHKRLSEVQSLFYQLSVLFEEGAEEQAKVLNEVLLIIFTICIRQSNVGVQRKHLQHTNKKESIRLAQKQLVYGNLLWFALERRLPVWAASWSEWRDWRTAPRTGWHSLLLSQSSTSVSRCETSEHLKTTDQPKRGEGPTINHCFASVKYNVCSYYCMTM